MNNYENNLDRVKEANIELFTNHEKTIEVMAKVLEYRDLETAGHSIRVVELSTKLAHLLGCSDAELEILRRGALLHDIGKLAIPDTILLKPGKLNAEEVEIIQQHPEYGKEMLNGIPYFQPVIPIVYSHHEHWDENGYPQGLKGKMIPFSARIFTIIDCWDALNSDRPYRAAWPKEKIVEYIQSESGKIFDPEIATKFLEMVTEKRERITHQWVNNNF